MVGVIVGHPVLVGVVGDHRLGGGTGDGHGGGTVTIGGGTQFGHQRQKVGKLFGRVKIKGCCEAVHRFIICCDGQI